MCRTSRRLNSVVIGDGTVSGERASDGATMQVSAELPAVISITEALPDARFPNFKGIMAAKKKPFETLTLEDLGIEPEDPAASRSIVLALSEKPPASGGHEDRRRGRRGREARGVPRAEQAGVTHDASLMTRSSSCWMSCRAASSPRARRACWAPRRRWARRSPSWSRTPRASPRPPARWARHPFSSAAVRRRPADGAGRRRARPRPPISCGPDAILISNSVEGRDVAGRYAARTRSGLCADVVGVSRDAEGVVAHHSVYGGAYNVDAAVTWGAPVITVRQGADRGAGGCRRFAVRGDADGRRRRASARHPSTRSTRPS